MSEMERQGRDVKKRRSKGRDSRRRKKGRNRQRKGCEKEKKKEWILDEVNGKTKEGISKNEGKKGRDGS